MKKLMIVAAAAAMTFMAQAKFALVQCDDCGAGAGDCDVAVFKVTGSGKAVVMAKNGEYNTVGTLKIQKGALAIEGDYCADNDACCYEAGMFYATLKAGSAKLKMAAEVEIPVWSVFGKQLANVQSYLTSVKKGGKVKLDSAMFVTTEGAEAVGEETDASDVAFWAAAFGSAKASVSKAGTGYCETSECDLTVVPGNYSGWFVAQYACIYDELCFRCDCDGIDVAGGTWKATYMAGKKTQAAAAKLAGVSIADED